MIIAPCLAPAGAGCQPRAGANATTNELPGVRAKPAEFPAPRTASPAAQNCPDGPGTVRRPAAGCGPLAQVPAPPPSRFPAHGGELRYDRVDAV